MIQKIADMAGVEPKAVILTFVFFAAAFVVLWIKM